MSNREIPTLVLTCLRCISKKPGLHLTEETVARAFESSSHDNRLDVTRLVINSVTDAGRFVDDAVPVSMFDPQGTFIDIKNAKVSAAYLKRLVNQSPGLEDLNVSGCFQVDDSIVNYVLQKCRNLKRLNIQNCRKLTDVCLEDIAQSGLVLTALDIGGNMNMTEQGLIKFLRSYPSTMHITELNLSGLPITEVVLATVTEKCRAVEDLGIAYALVHEENIRTLLNKIGKKLKKLNIAWLPCDDSRDTYNFSFFEHLTATCPKLEALDLCGLRTVTAATLHKFLEARSIKSESSGGSISPLKLLRVKFICTPKQQVEQLMLSFAPLQYDV